MSGSCSLQRARATAVGLTLVLSATVAVSAVLPKWEPTFRMNESTVFMPCNSSGMFDASFAARWGVADFDWSNAKQLWANTKPMDCEERLVDQVNAVHAINPRARTFVYRNLVKALPWFTSVREKLDDPAYSGFFLRFKPSGFFPDGSYHVPACTGSKCSIFYHDQDQTPEHPHGDGSCVDECDCGTQPCGEYLWDHRNGTMLRDFLVNDFVMGPTGMGAPGVSGFYFDDGWTTKADVIAPWMPKEGFCSHNSFGGATEENRWCVDVSRGGCAPLPRPPAPLEQARVCLPVPVPPAPAGHGPRRRRRAGHPQRVDRHRGRRAGGSAGRRRFHVADVLGD